LNILSHKIAIKIINLVIVITLVFLRKVVTNRKWNWTRRRKARL